MTLEKALNKFLDSRRMKGLSNKTIENYDEFIRPFIISVGKRAQPAAITQDKIENYILSLHERKLSKATIGTYTRHIIVFLAWLKEQAEVYYCLEKIPKPKMPKKTVHIYTPDEIRQIFETISAESEWLELRNKACIALMLDSGLRREEVCTLKKANYNAKGKTLVVYGKGEKMRTVPVGKFSQSFITEYLEACPYKDSKYLFVERHGTPMTGNALKQLMSKLSNKLPFEFSCHKLRHNFATNYCIDMYNEKGHMDGYSLQILMGHAELHTTMRYVHHAQSIVAATASISHLDLVFNH